MTCIVVGKQLGPLKEGSATGTIIRNKSDAARAALKRDKIETV